MISGNIPSPLKSIASPQTANASKFASNGRGNKVYSAAATAHQSPQKIAAGVSANVPRWPPVTNKKVPIHAMIIEMQSIRRGHCRWAMANQMIIITG